MTAEAIAHVCHEANRALQKEQNDPTIPVSVKWAKLDPETRRSAVEGVRNILTGKVRTPRASHEQWVEFKIRHGWVRGPVKDEAAKQHPLLVSYDELPAAHKVKDAMFFAIVQALGDIQIPLISDAKTNKAFREGADGQ